MLWYSVGALGALLTTFGFVPQILKMWRTRSVRDVSGATFVQFAIGMVFWTAYGIHLGDPVLTASNIVLLVTVVVALALYFRFARRRAP